MSLSNRPFRLVTNPGNKANKKYQYKQKLLDKTEAKLTQETDKQVDLVYHAAAIALKRMEKWSENKITDLVIDSQKVWDECGASNDVSMVQILEQETGIFLTREDSNRDYDDIMYLNSERDPGKTLNYDQWIVLRQNQKKWVSSQITACILVELHRREHWQTDRLARFFSIFEDVKKEYGYNEEALKKASRELTGFELLDGMI